VTLNELKALLPGDIVLWDGPVEPTPLVGEVVERDRRSVVIHFDDGTSALIWFAHVESLRDTRLANFRRPGAAIDPDRLVA
jgi:hypothetical protein